MDNNRQLKEQILNSTNDNLIPDHVQDIKSRYLMMESSTPSHHIARKRIFTFAIPAFGVVALTAVIVAFSLQSQPTIGYKLTGKSEAMQVSLVSAYNAINTQASASSKVKSSAISVLEGSHGDYPWEDQGPASKLQEVFSKINSYANTSEIILRDNLPAAKVVKSNFNSYKYQVNIGTISLYYNESKSDSLYTMTGIMQADSVSYVVTGSQNLTVSDAELSLTIALSNNYSLTVINHPSDSEYISCDYQLLNQTTHITSSFSLIEKDETINASTKNCVSLTFSPDVNKQNINSDFLFYLNNDDCLAGNYEVTFDEDYYGDPQNWGVEGSFYSDYDEYGDYHMHGDMHGYFAGEMPPDDNWDDMPPPPPEDTDWDWDMDYQEPRCPDGRCHNH